MSDKDTTVRVVCIHGDDSLTKFMQHFDAFERSKVIATATRLEVTLKPEVSVAHGLEVVRNKITEGGHRVVAIFSPDTPEGAWRDPSVKSVSNGTNFTTLDAMLEMHGWPESPALSA